LPHKKYLPGKFIFLTTIPNTVPRTIQFAVWTETQYMVEELKHRDRFLFGARDRRNPLILAV